MELVGANALLARRHKGERLKPDIQLDVAAFHDRLGGDAEILTALLGVAAPDARLLGAVMAPSRSTVRANGIAAPAEGFEVFAGLIGALKMRSVEHD